MEEVGQWWAGIPQATNYYRLAWLVIRSTSVLYRGRVTLISDYLRAASDAIIELRAAKRTDTDANDRRTQEAQNTFPGAENISCHDCANISDLR